MRHGTANRRQRNRNNSGGRRGNPNRAQVYDSNGPDVRIRGTAHQVCEKYLALAKDAASSGDRILAESYMQHAEHYQRLINQFDNTANDRDDENNEVKDKKADNSPQKDSTGNRKHTSADVANQEDDLSLPSSILGGISKEKPEAKVEARTPIRMEADTEEMAD